MKISFEAVEKSLTRSSRLLSGFRNKTQQTNNNNFIAWFLNRGPLKLKDVPC